MTISKRRAIGIKKSNRFQDAVAVELQRARYRRRPINSLNEGYAVIFHALEEFRAEAWQRSETRSALDLLKELIHIGAMAQRTAEDVVEMMLPKAPAPRVHEDRGMRT